MTEKYKILPDSNGKWCIVSESPAGMFCFYVHERFDDRDLATRICDLMNHDEASELKPRRYSVKIEDNPHLSETIRANIAEEVQQILDDNRHESFLRFFADHITADPDDKMGYKVASVIKHYHDYCCKNNLSPIKRTKFYELFKSKLRDIEALILHRNSNGFYITGVSIIGLKKDGLIDANDPRPSSPAAKAAPQDEAADIPKALQLIRAELDALCDKVDAALEGRDETQQASAPTRSAMASRDRLPASADEEDTEVEVKDPARDEKIKRLAHLRDLAKVEELILRNMPDPAQISAPVENRLLGIINEIIRLERELAAGDGDDDE